MPKRFSYYARLSDADKRIYRKSDAITRVELENASALVALVAELEAALETGKRVRVARATDALTRALCEQLGAPKVRVRVREVRPDIGGAELHGQYTFATNEETPTIEVWMRTLAHERVVKFRTFLRTLLHEIAHHLDATIFELGESFHTRGFFQRESSLVTQLLGRMEGAEPGDRDPRPHRTVRSKEGPVQLGLFPDLAAPSKRRRPTPAT